MSVNSVNLGISKAYLNSSSSSTSLKADNSFDTMVKNLQSDGNNNNVKNNLPKVSTNYGKNARTVQNKQDSNSKYAENDKNEDSKMETYLREAGFSDEEIADIKEKIKDGTIDQNSLYAVLNMVFGSNQNIEIKSGNFLGDLLEQINNKILDIPSINKLLDKLLLNKNSSDQNIDLSSTIKSSINDIKNIIDEDLITKLDFLKKAFGNSENGNEFIKKIYSSIAQYINSKLNQSSKDFKIGDALDLKSQIYLELVSKLNDNTINSTNNTLNFNNKALQDISSMNIGNNSSEQLNLASNNDNGQSNAYNSQESVSSESTLIVNDDKKGTSSENKEMDVLNKILNKGEEEPKVSKTVNFMSQFNTLNKQANVAISNTTENLIVNSNTFTSDILKSLEYMETNNIKELTVKISPKELGNITINLIMEEGKMKASITASNKDAYNLLNSNIQDLSNKLQNSDIKIQNFSLNMYHEDTTFFRDESRRGQHGKENKNGMKINLENVPEEDTQEEDYYSDNNVDMLA